MTDGGTSRHLNQTLYGLNDAQMRAVTSSPKGQLQIVAGPGTGKTKVLASRVAYLLLHHNLRPENIIVTTFTKKAANEMKERIAHMLGGSGIELQRLKIGTFHSICSRILSQYGRTIGVDRVRVAADRDWNDIMKSIINPLAKEVQEVRNLVSSGSMKPGNPVHIEGSNKSSVGNPYDLKKVKKQISKLKSKGLYPEEYSQQNNHNKELQIIFRLFQNKLEENGLLDFDDLLVKTNFLLSKVDCLKGIQHVLIDEFQDTNTVQLELMTRFAKGTPDDTNNISIVGDPDQSIYRFRDAVAMNFELMRQKYPECEIINLEENYRSTNDVLNFSEQLMRQQEKRLPKKLTSQFSQSFPVVYQTFSTREQEANCLAEEIKHLISLPALFDYSSFSILIRASYQSRVIETALNRNRVPYIIVKGRAFWERKEIETILDFMRVVAFDDDKPALLRTLVQVTTGIGAVTVKKLDAIIEEQRAQRHGSLSTLKKLSSGDIKISESIKGQLQNYLRIVQEARSCISGKSYTRKAVLTMFDYLVSQEPLKTLNAEEERAQNIEELKNQIRVFDPEEPISFNEDDATGEIQLPLLESFLMSIELQSTSDKKSDTRGAVCVSTIHSAKGLEWPVVFIPGLSEGSLPASFASKDDEQVDAIDEERRVFYVATTRAKQLLYITTPMEAEIWSHPASPSRFITKDVLKLVHQKQLALSNLENVERLYSSSGVEFVKDQHQVGALNTITQYELSYKQTESLLAMANLTSSGSFSFPKAKFHESSETNYYQKSKFNFQMRATPKIKEKVLPPPGLKSFAPGSKNIESEPKVPLAQFNKAPGNVTVKVEPSSIPNPVKRKKTLGVRRRMPMN